MRKLVREGIDCLVPKEFRFIESLKADNEMEESSGEAQTLELEDEVEESPLMGDDQELEPKSDGLSCEW